MKTEPAGNDTKISVRDKILLTAHDLFYSTGFRATGVDTLIKASKVTKAKYLLMRYPQRFTNGLFRPSSTAARLLTPAQRRNRKILKAR